MVKDEIKVINENDEYFDKKEIALDILDSINEDNLECSLIIEGRIIKCEDCRLKDICDGIDNTVKDYIEKNTKVVGNFSFE